MIRDLNTDLLRTFVTIVEAGSFSQAAQRLGRTQAAVSLALRRLEEDVAQSVLERSPRGVNLTAAGNLLLPHARKILGAADEARRELAGRSVRGLVRLGLIEDVAVGHLPRVLRRFSLAYPGIDLDIHVDSSEELSHRFDRAEFDLVLSNRDPFSIAPTLTWSQPLYWVGAKEFSVGKAPVPLVAFNGPCSWERSARAALDKAGLRWHDVCTSTSLLAVLSAVEAGLGVAVLLGNTIRSETMRILERDELPPLRAAEFGLFAGSAADAPTPARELANFLAEDLRR